jgi:hypothetical protein
MSNNELRKVCMECQGSGILCTGRESEIYDIDECPYCDGKGIIGYTATPSEEDGADGGKEEKKRKDRTPEMGSSRIEPEHIKSVLGVTVYDLPAGRLELYAHPELEYLKELGKKNA